MKGNNTTAITVDTVLPNNLYEIQLPNGGTIWLDTIAYNNLIIGQHTEGDKVTTNLLFS